MLPNSELRIGYSKLKQTKLMLIAAGLTALSASLAMHWLPGVASGSEAEFGGWAGLVFFGLCFCVLAWRLLTARSEIVILSAQGLTDLRIATEPIPWTAIRRISVFKIRRQRSIVITVAPQVEASLHLTRIAKWTREPNKRLGADGLLLTTGELKIDHDELLEAIEARRNATIR